MQPYIPLICVSTKHKLKDYLNYLVIFTFYNVSLFSILFPLFNTKCLSLGQFFLANLRNYHSYNVLYLNNIFVMDIVVSGDCQISLHLFSV